MSPVSVPVDPIPQKEVCCCLRRPFVTAQSSDSLNVKIMEDTMGKPVLAHESRCLLILAGGVLERRIECRARTIAASRSAEQISPEDVKKATAEFLLEELSDLPQLVQRAMSKHRNRSSKAA
jgi:hypothetical protein